MPELCGVCDEAELSTVLTCGTALSSAVNLTSPWWYMLSALLTEICYDHEKEGKYLKTFFLHFLDQGCQTPRTKITVSTYF